MNIVFYGLSFFFVFAFRSQDICFCFIFLLCFVLLIFCSFVRSTRFSPVLLVSSSVASLSLTAFIFLFDLCLYFVFLLMFYSFVFRLFQLFLFFFSMFFSS
ncbi:hypothetical protein I3842_Q102800 [Carya illinoinensis]|uniref:Uncharacterized protein n=1 Tax=Carya illinoinensis TaxID=32201 RepID=A0A922D2J0_CARIL|nr:hypothetical protein I3842_Q102800 [Carya illinoinensis]